MKKIFVLHCIFLYCFCARSQGLLGIPGQTVMIAKAVEMLKLTQSTFQTLQAQESQLAYMKTFMQQEEENLKHLDNIKNLKINQIDDLLNEILCLKGGNRFYQLRFSNAVDLIKGAYGKCDNSDVFKMTWAGITRNFNEQMGSGAKNLSAFVSKFNTHQAIIDQNNLLNRQMETAYACQQVGNSYNEQTTVELATKYKQISDDLMKMSHQLNQALNMEGNDALQVSKGERLMLLSKAMDYQVKALEYEEKYAQLLKEGTALSENNRKELSGYRKAMSINESILFRP